jgi:hypothetical protein
MKTKFVSRKVIAAGLACLLLMLACNVFTGTTPAAEPVDQPTEVEQVPVPSNTPKSLEPVNTPEPTATQETLATPTPAPVGVAVRSDSYEVTVIKAVKLDRLYPGGKYSYTPKAGNMIVDVGVKVSNLTGSQASVKWSNVYVVEETGDAWYPSYGTYKESGKEIDPFSLGISENTIVGEDVITFKGDIYLRLIFIVADNDPTTFVFGFDDSPLIEITIK